MTDTMAGKTAQREYSMDLLRVILIFMVIVLHYNNRGMGGALNYGADGGMTEIFVRMTESLCICAVDTFMMLSGYFAGARHSSPYRKAVWLLAACSFYRTVAYILHAVLVIHEFSFRTLISYVIPSNWFVCLFVTVLLLSPFIDRLIGLTTGTKMDELMLILTGAFVILPSAVSLISDAAGVDLYGLTTITVSGDAEGFSIVAFLYSYILGSYVRKQKKYFDTLSWPVYLLVYLLSAALAASLSYTTESVWSYSGLLTVLEALSLTVLFSRIRIDNEHVGRVLSAIGGCSLGIFIWHTTPLMLYGFWVHFNIDTLSGCGPGMAVVNMLAACLAMYAVSGVWVYVCRRVSALVKKKNAK